jgi:Fe-S cluster biogenesis protein NfuA
MSILSIEKQEIRQRVELALRQIRPYLEADGGDVSLSDITDDLVVKVELHGACKTCNMSQMTMKAGVEDVIKKAGPEVSSVIAVDRQQ